MWIKYYPKLLDSSSDQGSKLSAILSINQSFEVFTSNYDMGISALKVLWTKRQHHSQSENLCEKVVEYKVIVYNSVTAARTNGQI